MARRPEETPRRCVLRGVTGPSTPLVAPLWRRRTRRAAVPGLEPGVRPDAAHFAAAACRNCGAALATPYCGECGQQKATRFGLRAVGSEAWQAWRWFELDVLRSAWRLLIAPGHVAREYVLGARKRHVHPLKLLLLVAGLLLLVLSRGGLLASDAAAEERVLVQVRAWSNWSFSLGIVAMFAAVALAFAGRGYNATERLVLALYAQVLVLGAALANHLPTLLLQAPAFVAAHRAWSPWFMNAVGVAVLLLAATQFFGLHLRRDGARLLLAAVLYLGLRWLLLLGYGRLVVRLVLGPSP